ncbi:MAG: hypothetical protein AAGG44_12025 [Planctomycetota bacterium]
MVCSLEIGSTEMVTRIASRLGQLALSCVIVVALPGAAGTCYADEDSNSEKKKAVKKASNEVPDSARRAGVTEKSKANSGEFDRKRVEQFVAEHQQELGGLLDFLREKQPVQYERAMREISRTRARLETLERRDAEMHAIELELWQLKSQQRLVAAEWAAASKESRKRAAETRLKRLLEDEQRQNLKKLVVLQKRARAQVEKLTQQIKTKRSSVDETVERGMRVWKARIEGPRKKTKAATGNAKGTAEQTQATVGKESKTDRSKKQ